MRNGTRRLGIRGTGPRSVRGARAGRTGLALAILALLGQLLVAAPHEIDQLVAVLCQAAPTAQTLGVAGVVHAGQPSHAHDPATCPICQASALARTAVSSAWIAHAPGPVEPARRLAEDRSERAPAAPVDATAAPRAPPARVVPT